MPSDDLFSNESDDPWPDEPDEPSESLGPEIPEAPDYSTRDVPDDLQRAFWTIVLLLNVGLFATSLGLMLAGFQGRWRFGGALVLVGLVALLRAGASYRSVRKG